VPVIAPVELLMLKPAGSDGETAKVRGAVPLDAWTGINEEAA
jgi:hypothetical protein